MPVRRPASLLLLLSLAVLGAVLAVDALGHSGLARYRLFGIAAGALLILPAAIAVLGGERGRWLLRRLAFALLPALAVLLVVEVVLRVAGLGDFASVAVASERLGHELAPGRGEADANGFRNAAVPEHAEVLFVGDSQTWGHGVRREECYVQRFQAATGRSAYGMALGAYGPVQYRELVRRGLALRPRDVVVGLYPGNDLFDAHRFAWLEGADDLRAAATAYPPRDEVIEDRPAAPNLAVALLDSACSASRVLGMAAEALRGGLRGSGGVYADEPGLPRWSGDPVATLFQTNRLAALDPGSADVQDGLRITKLCLLQIGERCRQAGARPWLLLLPTKEACYRRWLGDRAPPELAAVTKAEAEVTAAVLAMAAEAGCTVVDPNEALVGELAAGHAMWPAGSDGHFAAAGHALLARELAAALR